MTHDRALNRVRASFTALLKLSVAAVSEQHVQQIVLEVGVAGEPFTGSHESEGKRERKKCVRQSSKRCPNCFV